VFAFRKANGLGWNGFAGRRVFFKLFRKRGRFRVRHRWPRRHVEFDWSRQVLVLVRRGRAWRTYHASSGTAATPTVFGRFRFYRKQPGTNSHGMVHSNYFIGGYAIHGYPSVPSYPASHGCIRIPIPNAAQVNRRIRIGERIFVYR
jgi:lipoprotein-anchoring transpeptidase ErfK/SrfK